MYFMGDFNCHLQHWWPAGDTNAEGTKLDELMSSLGLTQLISEPTNFEPHKNPSCIDIIFTDQPNIVMESSTRASLNIVCHHQMVNCRVNLKPIPPPPYERKVWHYSRANVRLLRRSIQNFDWINHFRTNSDPNWQAESFTEILLNIISNFVTYNIVKIKPKEPPWITIHLKSMLKKQNRLYRNYKRHGFKSDDKIRVDQYNNECKTAVDHAKQSYLNKLGDKLSDANT